MVARSFWLGHQEVNLTAAELVEFCWPVFPARHCHLDRVRLRFSILDLDLKERPTSQRVLIFAWRSWGSF